MRRLFYTAAVSIFILLSGPDVLAQQQFTSDCPPDGEAQHWDKIVFKIRTDPSRTIPPEYLKVNLDLKILDPPETVLNLDQEVRNAVADMFNLTPFEADRLKIEILDVKYQIVTCAFTGPQGQQGVQGTQGPQGPPGPPTVVSVIGVTGEQGPPGTDGVACWDSNGNGLCDGGEDNSSPSGCDVLDCQGVDGADGAAGLACWDTNGNRMCDLGTEDQDGDNDCDIDDCRGPPGGVTIVLSSSITPSNPFYTATCPTTHPNLIHGYLGFGILGPSPPATPGILSFPTTAPFNVTVGIQAPRGVRCAIETPPPQSFPTFMHCVAICTT